MNRTRSPLTRGIRYTLASLFALVWVAACTTETIPEDDLGSAGTSASAGMTNRAGSNSNAGMSPSAGDSGEGGDAGMPEGGSMNMGGRGGAAGNGVGGAAAGNGGSSGGGVVCGNNKTEAGEECDDGNKKNGDGCSETCTKKCETCEKALCLPDLKPSFDDCFGDGVLGASPVTTGPGAGQTQAQVCQDLVSCARRTGCAKQQLSNPVVACLCSPEQDAAACTAEPKGPCANEVAAAAYSRTFADIQARYNKTSYPIGRANQILSECDFSACRSECMFGKDKTACESCALGPNPTNSNFVCSGYGWCTLDDFPLDCVGKPPKDGCIAAACSPAVECALRTGCGLIDPLNCYANGSGPCADEFAKAANSTDNATIVARMKDGSYAAYIAVELLKCEAQNCKSACFPGATGGSGGAGGSSSSGNGGTGG